jgi:hypothetical protein
MAGADVAGLDEAADNVTSEALLREIDMWRRAIFSAPNFA